MNTGLRIARGLILDPDYVAGGTFALLAKKGAGKSYTGRVMAEELWNAKVPFVVLDPMSAWWGLRSSADGTEEGIGVAIFGGDHGDAPLERTAGALMADLAIDEGLSMILDLKNLGSRAAERQFAHDFLERLYRRNKDLIHLFIDEADLFAPQKPQSGDLPLLGVTENIVRRGRNAGIGITLITQRPAVLNKDVLTQVDGLVAMRIVGLTDRQAIDKWVEGHGDTEAASEVKGTLAGLANGECWWWIPERDVLKRVQVRQARTFDSSPTRRRGETRREPKSFADVDMAGIEAKMAETIERAKADDPRELRRRIRELEQVQVPEMPKPERVEVPVLNQEEISRLEYSVDRLRTGIEEAQQALAEDLAPVVQAASDLTAKLEHIQTSGRDDTRRPVGEPSKPELKPHRQPGAPAAASHRGARPPASEASSNGSRSLARAERAILSVLAQFPAGRTKRQLALLAGYSAKGGGFNNALSALRTARLIERGEPILITHEGADAIDGAWEPLPVGPSLLDYWMGQVGKAERMILGVLADHFPEQFTKEELGEATGYSPTGGGFNNALSRLRTLELIDGRGAVSLAVTLGEELR